MLCPNGSKHGTRLRINCDSYQTDSSVTLVESLSPSSSFISGNEFVAGRPGELLRRRFVAGSLWAIAGYGARQLLRLAGNVLLASLLFPEAFGIILLVNAVHHGLQMFSDLGIGVNIIQSRHGDDPGFRTTAWTIQCCRGCILSVVACLVAWPMATFYDEPRLVWLVVVVGVSALFDGLTSTTLFTLTRRLELGKVVGIELASQLLGLVVAVVWALIEPSVWALAASPVVAALMRMVLSHTMLPSFPHRLHWDPTAARELLHFGKWIFVSTALGFIVARGDQLILGRIFTKAELGQYFVAIMFSQGVIQVLRVLSAKVLLPAYVQLAESRPAQLRHRVFQIRVMLLLASLPPLWLLVVWGPEIVGLLFDDRYHDVGWILQILAAGNIVSACTTTAGSVLLPLGDSFRFMLWLAGRSAFLLGAMAVGAWLGGVVGIIVGIAVSELLSYPILAWGIRKHDLWMPGLDVCAFVVSGCVIGLGLLLSA